MNIIDHRQFTRRKPHRRLPQKRLVYIGAAVVGGLLVLNGIMAIMYAGKALPGYRLGNLSVGGKKYSTIEALVNEQNESALKLTLQKDATSRVVMAKDMGITIDKQASAAQLKHARPVLPMVGWFVSRQVPLVVHTDEATFKAKSEEIATVFLKQPQPRHIAFVAGEFKIADAENGYKLDKTAFQTAFQKAVGKQRMGLQVPTVSIASEDGPADLPAEQAKLTAQTATKLVFQINGTKVAPTKEEIGSWYSQSGQTMMPDTAKVQAYVVNVATKQGSSASNRSDIAIAAKYLLGRKLGQTLLVTGQGARMHTYCTATRGVSADEVSDLVGKLAATYADPRGWTDNGRIAFQYAENGCDYTVWLASPANMTSFGAICDSYYNCQVGNNVIVNNDRWLYATEAWNKTSQDLETYRLLIINHETGHRLGFRDNPVCPGVGTPAPVMMQQSISLEGCTFNTWPLASELSVLESML